MSTQSLILVLAAAALHAGWNAVVKASGDRLVASWAIVVAAALVNIPIVAIVGLPARRVWWLVALSAIIHLAYSATLAIAYDRADLSVAYPLARGTAPLIVTIGGIALLDDPVSAQGIAGVVLVSASLAVLATTRPPKHVTWPIVVGLAIAGYTLTDGAGVRENGGSVPYISAVFVAQAIPMSIYGLWQRGTAPLRAAVAATPGRLLLGGAASATAYLLVMIAARTEPLGLVAGLRETSALFGMWFGARLLHEPITRRQAVATCCAVAGAIAIAAA